MTLTEVSSGSSFCVFTQPRSKAESPRQLSLGADIARENAVPLGPAHLARDRAPRVAPNFGSPSCDRIATARKFDFDAAKSLLVSPSVLCVDWLVTLLGEGELWSRMVASSPTTAFPPVSKARAAWASKRSGVRSRPT